MRLALCNELLAREGKDLAEQCRIAAALRYDGLELAPGTLAERPHAMSAADARAVRTVVEDHGLRVTGLHWLLSPYPELSITDPDRASETREALRGLVRLCAELGGSVLVHGSPGQRRPPEGEDGAALLNRVADFFAPIAREAEGAGVVYCIEPLSPAETPFLNTVAEAWELVDRIDSPCFLTMIDASAAGQAERAPVAELIRDWVPSGFIGHVQLNDTNRGAPGTGDDPFPDIVGALRAVGWERTIAIEPFRTVLDATATAAIGAATVRACWAAATP